MKKSNYTEEQIAFALKQAELGTPVLGGMPEARDCGADVLSPEEQVWRNAAERHEAATAA